MVGLEYPCPAIASHGPGPAPQLCLARSRKGLTGLAAGVGWLSARLCEFPQEVILQFDSLVRLSALQVRRSARQQLSLRDGSLPTALACRAGSVERPTLTVGTSQILSNESSIAQKVELFVGASPGNGIQPPDLRSAQFRRLGYVRYGNAWS